MSKLQDITPSVLACGIGMCPAIFKDDDGSYVLIGKRIELPELDHRIGPGEVAVRVPAELIDYLK